MSGPKGKSAKSELAFREARKTRLSDSILLDVFMKTRKEALAKGCSIIESNEHAHEAVDAQQRARSTVVGATIPTSDSLLA